MPQSRTQILDRAEVSVPDSAGDTKQSERAYVALRDMIVRMELRPGADLSERVLSDQLGFGRTPVREAILRLVSDRLVEISAGRGMSVAPINFEEVRDIYEVRLNEDRLAARLFLANADDHSIGMVCRCFDDAPGFIKVGNFAAVLGLDFHFHRLFFVGVRNQFLVAQHDFLRAHYHRLAWLAASRRPQMRTADGMKQLVRSHDPIIEAIKQKSFSKLDVAISEHVIGSFGNVVSILSQSRMDLVSELKAVDLFDARNLVALGDRSKGRSNR